MSRPTSKMRALSVALGAVVLAGYVLHAWYFRAYVNDDAYITFRYSRNLAAGHGPVYNVGEQVEGYTNFLLMLVLAGVIKVAGPGAAPLAAQVIGVVGGLTALGASWAVCRAWLRRVPAVAEHAGLLAWAAPALATLNAAFALNSMSGLETTLFSAWILVGVWLLQKTQDGGRWCGAGVALALAALTRPEGVLLAVVLLVVAGVSGGGRAGRRAEPCGTSEVVAGVSGGRRARPGRGALVIDTAIVVVVIGAHLAFRFAYYDGELVPNTYYAKVGDDPWSTRAAGYLWDFARYHLGGVACGLALLPLAAREATLRRAILPGLVACGLAVAGNFKTGPDWMLGYRPLVAYAPLWAALAVVGLAAVAERGGRRVLPVTGVACALLLLLISRQVEIRRQYHASVEAAAHGYAVGHAALAEWLHAQTRPGETVALMDIGIVGYRNPALRILDISGLTDRAIAKSPGGLFHKRYDPGYVLGQRPRYIVLVITDYRKPDGTTGYMALTPAEALLAKAPEFAARYHCPPPAVAPSDELESVAASLGAVRIFQHEDPKAAYLLTVFERQE